MEVTRDVVKDLLTIYLSDEASADTKRLVEEYLQTDAELARDVEHAREAELRLPALPASKPTAEREALEATRRLLKNRTSTLVMAVLFTVLPFTFVLEGSRITFLLIREAPVVGSAWLATAAVMWAWHFWIRRRLRVAGL